MGRQPQKTVDDRRSGSLILRLNDHLPVRDVPERSRKKPFVLGGQAEICVCRRDRKSTTTARFVKQGPIAEDGAKLLWPFVAGYRLSQQLQTRPFASGEDHREAFFPIHPAQKTRKFANYILIHRI